MGFGDCGEYGARSRCLAVVYATMTGGDTHGLHRTWSHGTPFMVLVFMVFYILCVVGKSRRIGNLVLGIRNVDAFHL